MKVLFIFNYQREVPPFMQTAISFAKEYFDKILYVSRKLTNDNTDTIRYSNVEVVQVSDRLRKAMFSLSPIRGLTNKYILSDFFKYRDISLLKAQLTTQFMSDCLYYTAKHLVLKHLKEDHDIYTLATWFSSEAVTIGRLSRRFDIRKTVSFAHSFEIDPDKNRFVNRSFNAFKHYNIDEVHYISHKMKEIYYKTSHDLKIEERFDNKAFYTYLGSVKYFNQLCSPSSDGIFRIISCSGVTPVKRLHLIIETLKNWDENTAVEWTHIGGGSLFQDIKEKSEKLMKINPKVSVKLLGWKNNKDVQKYYSENPVDLFINVSEAEGLPVSIMEAMSYGIPCIATNVGGTSEIVNEQTGSLLAKGCTNADILRKIKDYSELSLSEKAKYRDAAFEIWKSDFDAQKTMTEFFKEFAE